MAMNTLYPKKIILLCILVLLPSHGVMAGSFSDVLQAMGISIAPSGLRSTGSFMEGNLWLSKINQSGTNEPKPITRDGNYHSPLWIPGSNKILAIKENKLVYLEIDGSAEKILFSLPDSITLHGFDKRNANSVLILQKKNDGPAPSLLSLVNGQITLLPYDKENKEDGIAVERLRRDYRKYGHVEVLIDSKLIVDAGGNTEEINKIHIKVNQKDIVIPCPENCAQPALTEDRRQLVFVGP